jgi:cytochrome c biogenesis protein
MRSPAEYAVRYGNMSNLLMKLEITDLYHSWWFNSLLFLFSLNIIICTLTRLAPKWKKTFSPRIESSKKNILSLKVNNNFKMNSPLEKVKGELKKEISSKKYKIREETAENNTFLFARKRVLGPFGSDIVHIGLLVILAGGILSGLSGFRTNINIAEGQTLPIPEADFQLRLDEFKTEYHPNGSVKDWKSTLTVLDNGKSMVTKTIEVNHPLTYKGFVFYQSAFGWNWENPSLSLLVKKKTDPTFQQELKLKIGETTKISDDITEVTALRFVPDFVIGENRQIGTRSLDPNNPAVLIEGRQNGEQVFSAWIFAKFPDIAQMHEQKETDLSFEFKDFTGSSYSGIQVAKDPGANFIWIGCAFLMLGLLIAFYWPTREIRIILGEDQGKTEIIAGGIAAKNKDSFQEEFEKIIATVRR